MSTLRFTHLALVAALFSVALSACDSGEPGPSENTAPEVISPNAFTFDNSFPEQSGANKAAGANFVNAALRVGIVTAAVGINLIVPSAATRAATQGSPIVVDGTWIWENTVPINGESVTFRLEGDPHGTQIDWRMVISAANLSGETYDEFTLYTATTALNGQSGEWHLFYRFDGVSTEVLNAEYDEDSDTVREITFFVPETNPDEAARGGSVRYAADGSTRLFDWSEPADGQTHLVEWDATTGAGFIEAWNYNNGIRSCWDGSLNDTACTAS